jgi:N-acetylneuraminate lyase
MGTGKKNSIGEHGGMKVLGIALVGLGMWGEKLADALRESGRFHLKKGVNGFYVGGSTAEAFLLSLEERKRILEVVAAEAKGECALIYHVGCIGTGQAIELAKHAKGVGVDAISSIPPFYYKFSSEEIKSYYLDIVDAVDLPMIVYNVPAFSGVTLTSENLKQFRADGRIIGVKHTSMDLYQLNRMKQVDPRLIIYNGHDEVFLAGLAMGADGAIGSTYNFMAEKFLEINRLYHTGQIKAAQQIQNEANEIIAVLIKVGVFQGIRYILKTMGLDSGECRKPFKPLSPTDRDLLDRVIHKYAILGV